MDMQHTSKSQFRLALDTFWQNRLARAAFIVLCLFYFCAVFADFLSPYSFKNENRDYSFAAPTTIHWVDEEGRFGPFVYGLTQKFDEYRRRVFTEDKTQTFPVKFVIKGEEYKFLGLFKTSRHLFGVDDPGRLYFWGADSRGRDLLSRILYGARISLSIGLIGVAISFSIGLFVGGIAGYYGGGIDNVLMRACEMVMMIPGFYLLLALRAAVPDNFNSVQIYLAIVVILSFIGWASLARIIRGMCLSLRSRDYVLAAKTMGVSDVAIILRHILPQTLSYSIISITLSIPGYILGESALSLLGLGIQDPYASWGNLLSDAMSIVRITFAPWVLIPGLLILITVICFNLIGDALRDALDPMFKNDTL